MLELLLQNCSSCDNACSSLLELASIAIENEKLFDMAINKCTNVNGLLENGETFLTNLFKTNQSEEIINRIIDRKIFDMNMLSGGPRWDRKTRIYSLPRAARMRLKGIISTAIGS